MHLVDLGGETRGAIEQLIPKAPETIVAPVGGDAWQLHVERDEFRLGVDESHESLKIAPVEGFVRPVHQLDILLRHRLLPQPGGFEGFGFLMGEEELSLLHKAVIVQRPDAVADDIHLDPATGASARQVCAYEDFVALDPEIERLNALFLEGVRLQPFAQRGDAFNRRLAPLADKLEVGMDQLNHGLEVAAIERVVESPKSSDHLLVSHRPRSISRGAQPPRDNGARGEEGQGVPRMAPPLVGGAWADPTSDGARVEGAIPRFRSYPRSPATAPLTEA